MQVSRHLAGDPWHRLELLAGGRDDRVGRAEVLEQGPLAGGPDARQLVEDRRRHRTVTPLAVVGDRKPVGLVSQTGPAPVSGNLVNGTVTAGMFQYDRITEPTNPVPQTAEHDNVSASVEGLYQTQQFLQTWLSGKAPVIRDPYTDLTIALELNYFQLNRAEYFVPVVVKIPGQELALAKKGGAEHTLIDFLLEVKDDLGNQSTVQNMRDNVNIKLTDATAAELTKRPIEYDTGFTLLPGKYTIKFLARDDETGRIGTFQTSFVIPNLNKELKKVPISSVVLSGQRVDMKDAIYNAAKAKEQVKDNAANPLVLNGQKLIPSVTRVFSKSRDLFVYLQAYEQGATTVQPLMAFVSFYQGKTKVFETQPMEVASGMTNSLKTMPLRFDVGLSQLPEGEYDCQVTVLDPTGGKSAFWQAPITLVP